MSYFRFAAMIASNNVMFALMYLNAYPAINLLSQTPAWIAVMGAAMAVMMLLFAWGMYGKTRAIIAILMPPGGLRGSAGAGPQPATVGDLAYMMAMITHHSIPIMTSERARIMDDAGVRELADEILAAQLREIAEMKAPRRSRKQHPPGGWLTRERTTWSGAGCSSRIGKVLHGPESSVS